MRGRLEGQISRQPQAAAFFQGAGGGLRGLDIARRPAGRAGVGGVGLALAEVLVEGVVQRGVEGQVV